VARKVDRRSSVKSGTSEEFSAKNADVRAYGTERGEEIVLFDWKIAAK
jgi:hypothetical protein